MKTNPILEETWRVKDELAREAGYDVHRFFDGLRQWSAANPHAGQILRGPEDLRRLAVEEEQKRTVREDMALNDKPAQELER